MRKELLRTICASTIILGSGFIIGNKTAYAQSADLTPIIINPEDVYKVNTEKPGNFYSNDYKLKVEKLEQENQNLRKVIKTIRQDVAGQPESNQNIEGEVVNLKSNLYDLQKNNGELKSALSVATKKIDVLQNFVDKQKLNEKYLTHRIKNIDDEIDEWAKNKINKLEDQNESLRETIQTVNESLMQKEKKLAAGQIQLNTTYDDQQKQIQALTLSSDNMKNKIEELQVTVAALMQDNAELIEENKSLKANEQTTDSVVSAKSVTEDIKGNVFFKKDVISLEKIETKELKDEQLSSLDLLKIDATVSDIEYVRGEKEMIAGKSDQDHMEKTTKIETNYPPLEDTVPRQSFNN